MDILKVILPVFLMIAIGFIGRKVKFLNTAGIDCIKFLVMKIILPVAIFHALGTMKYTVQTLIPIGIMLAVLLISFGAGFLLKPLLKEPYKKYLPFLVSVYEGGLMAYPLYTNLFGTENLSQIVLLDIACLLFGFSVYMGMLEQTEESGKVNVKRLALSALKNPTFIATLLGVIFGTTGLLNLLIESSAGGVYGALVDIVTASLSPLVLIIIGFNFKLEKKILVPCLITIALRILVQATLTVAVIFTLHAIMEPSKLLDFAVIMFMACPTSFSTQSFLKTEEGGQYVSTTNSLYCSVTVIVYVVLAFLI